MTEYETKSLALLEQIAANTSKAAAPRPAQQNTAGGPIFPPYGKSQGLPVAGASMNDLEFYATNSRKTLSNPEKARFHDKERAFLAVLEAEMAKHGSFDPPPPSDADAPPGDLPF